MFIEYCVFLEDFKIYSGEASLGFPSVSVCVNNGRSKTSTAVELAEFRKITTLRKNAIFNEHSVKCKFFVNQVTEKVELHIVKSLLPCQFDSFLY